MTELEKAELIKNIRNIRKRDIEEFALWNNALERAIKLIQES